MQLLFFNDTLASFLRSQRRWALGTCEVLEKASYVHLGIECNKYMKNHDIVKEAASKIRRTFFAILNSGLCETDLHPFTLRKIYQTVVLPRALYGCEFWHDLSESQRLHLERSHRLCVKTMQGIDQRTRSCVALNLLGIPNLESEIMKKKCTLFGQTCRLDPYYSVKRIVLHRLTSHYFLNDVKYGFIVDTLRIITESLALKGA